MPSGLERLKPLILILISIILVGFWPEARFVKARRPNYNIESSQWQADDKSLEKGQVKIVHTCKLIPGAPKFDLCYIKYSVKECVDWVRQSPVRNLFNFYYNQCCNTISKSCPLIFKCQFCPLCFMNNDYLKCFVEDSPDKNSTSKPSYQDQSEEAEDCDD